MKKITGSAIVLAAALAAALATGACAKHDDVLNTTSNDTIVTDETTNAGALDENLSTTDGLGNVPDTAADNGSAAPANAL